MKYSIICKFLLHNKYYNVKYCQSLFNVLYCHSSRLNLSNWNLTCMINLLHSNCRLSMKLHPDRNMNKADAAEAFRKVSEAYQVLSSPESRQEYDCKVLGTR